MSEPPKKKYLLSLLPAFYCVLIRWQSILSKKEARTLCLVRNEKNIYFKEILNFTSKYFSHCLIFIEISGEKQNILKLHIITKTQCIQLAQTKCFNYHYLVEKLIFNWIILYPFKDFDWFWHYSKQISNHINRYICIFVAAEVKWRNFG